MDKALKLTYIVCASIVALFLYAIASYFVLQKIHWAWILIFTITGSQLSTNIFKLMNNTKDTNNENE